MGHQRKDRTTQTYWQVQGSTKRNNGYSKPCIFCKQEIKMSNDSGNWLPYNLDGSYTSVGNQLRQMEPVKVLRVNKRQLQMQL